MTGVSEVRKGRRKSGKSDQSKAKAGKRKKSPGDAACLPPPTLIMSRKTLFFETKEGKLLDFCIKYYG